MAGAEVRTLNAARLPNCTPYTEQLQGELTAGSCEDCTY